MAGFAPLGKFEYCAAFKPPREIEDFVGDDVQRMYLSLFAPITFFAPPLKYIFDRLQENSGAISDAFDFVVRRKCHNRSIEQ